MSYIPQMFRITFRVNWTLKRLGDRDRNLLLRCTPEWTSAFSCQNLPLCNFPPYFINTWANTYPEDISRGIFILNYPTVILFSSTVNISCSLFFLSSKYIHCTCWTSRWFFFEQDFLKMVLAEISVRSSLSWKIWFELNAGNTSVCVGMASSPMREVWIISRPGLWHIVGVCTSFREEGPDKRMDRRALDTLVKPLTYMVHSTCAHVHIHPYIHTPIHTERHASYATLAYMYIHTNIHTYRHLT